MTGAPDKKKFPDTYTHTNPEGPWDFKEPSTVPQRHLNTRCRGEEEGGVLEGRHGNGDRGEKEKKGGHGHEREKEIKLKVDGRGEEVCVES